MAITIGFHMDENGFHHYVDSGKNPSAQRTEKGKSRLIFPDDYVVIDIETTGLSPELDDIIEIAGIKYKNGEKIDEFSSLVKPPREDGEEYVWDYITKLTGITNEMLKDAPTTSEVIPMFYSFIGDSVLMGHNVNFDINFLYDEFSRVINKPLTNDFIDTMRMSRRVHPEEKHHRLKDLVKRYDITQKRAHRALDDCEVTKEIYDSIKDDIRNLYGSFEEFKKQLKVKKKTKPLDARDISTDKTEFDEDHPLFGMVCVFTGTLEKMPRKEAMQLVVDFGGEVGNGVTKKTNYLILGNNDYCKTIKDGKSSKQKKAEKLKLEGQDIEIIPENVFYDMINE